MKDTKLLAASNVNAYGAPSHQRTPNKDTIFGQKTVLIRGGLLRVHAILSSITCILDNIIVHRLL